MKMDFETAQMVNNAGCACGNCGSGRVARGDVVRSNQWESIPPPFLRKIFEMVDDVETNSIISWNSTGTGFIIWDHNKFSVEILPRLFRTSNSSSFIYQLNKYGFRKISWERYEYAWFEAGKKHWLKNIKRRNQQCKVSKETACFAPDHFQCPMNATMEKKLDAILSEQSDIRRKHETLRKSLDNMEDQLASLQTNTASLLNLLMEHPGKETDQGSGDNVKRRRLVVALSTECEVELADKVEISTHKLPSSADDDDSGSSTQNQNMKETVENAGNCQFWKEMMEEVAGFNKNEGGQGDLADHHSKAMMELDEMIASDIPLQREILITRPSDPDAEDDGQLDLWT